MSAKQRLSESAFLAAIQPMARLSEQSVAIARAILVEGKSQKSQADEYGLSRGVVSNLVNRIYKAAKPAQPALPRGFQRVELVLPEKLVPVAKMLEKAGKHGWPEDDQSS